MFNNEALDVVIGIVLIYLLYSMLVTLIGEYIATKLGVRARMMRVGIERMLNDGYLVKEAQKKDEELRKSASEEINKGQDNSLKLAEVHKIRVPHKLVSGQSAFSRYFLGESPHFQSSFAGRFYSYPAIKFLSRVQESSNWFSLTKPSYISDDYFADALINMLKDKSSGTTDAQKITYALQYNTQHIQPQTLKVFRGHWENAVGDPANFKINLMKWFNETMDRTTGWYKRKLQLILLLLGLIVATSFNVDTIRIIRILSKDKEARGQLVAIGVQMAKDSIKYKNYQHAASDTSRGHAVLDSGLSHVIKDISSANLILGIGWRLDTLTIADNYELKTKDVSYTTAHKSAGANNQLNMALKRLQLTARNDAGQLRALCQDSTETYLNIIVLSNGGTLPGKNAPVLAVQEDNLAKLKKSIQVQKAVLSLDSLALTAQAATLHLLIKPLLKEDYTAITQIDTAGKDEPVTVSGIRHLDFVEKTGRLFAGIALNFAGLFLTALALSMGSPFWFDLLNKLVSIRSSGPRPEVKELHVASGPKSTDTGGMPIAPGAVDPATQALNDLTAKLSSEHGIVSLGLLRDKRQISVLSTSAEIVSYLSGRYGTTCTLSDGTTFAVVYGVSTSNTYHTASTGSGISNKAHLSAVGTLGGFLKKTGENGDYFISCWHVMKDDNIYHSSVLEHAIVDQTPSITNPSTLGSICDGCLADKIDVGIARWTAPTAAPGNKSESGFQVNKQYRAVTPYDAVVSTPVTIFGAATAKVTKAKVLLDQQNASIPYPDGKEYMLYDVFSLVSPDNTVPTTPGDSGALVLDASGAPLGMIVGGNGSCSYAVKFTNMFDINQPYHGYYFTL